MKKFKKNDRVIIISGSSKGKIGNIIQIKDKKAVVQGVNLKTVHKKPTSTEQGKIIKKEVYIDLSNISHVENNKAIKIKYVTSGNEAKPFKNKVRQNKENGNQIENK